MYQPRSAADRPDGLSRRAFIVHVGAAAALLKTGSSALAQSASPAVPGKERLIVRSPRPVNLETPLKELTSEVTPVELFYVRNNYDGPEIDSAQYVLKVQGEVDNPLSLRLDDLRQMEQVTQTVTLECAGNGRGFYNPKAAGIQWEHGAVGTGVWKGVRLADVLRRARPRPAARHVVPNGTMARPRRRRPISFAATPCGRPWSLTRSSRSS
jgi:DMSO/TMAO reductase YedYZ molybdopterin-dependent catalytic subunit